MEWGSGHQRYEQIQEIGVGAYGTVYRARDRENDGQIVALKRLRVQASEEGMPLATVREIALLKQLERFDHPNIVRLLDVCCGRRTARETRLTLVFEHVDYDLETFMQENNPIDLSKVKDIAKQLLTGLDFLHSQRVVHRDLKPQNVLISQNMVVRIADFGLARLYCADSSLTQVVVTLWYRAPEVLLHRSYHSGVDLWGCGCIVAELLNNQPLFMGNGEISQLRTIFDTRGLPPESDWPSESNISRQSFLPEQRRELSEVVTRATPDCLELLEGLLKLNPNDRLSASEALRCAWFTRIGNANLYHARRPGAPTGGNVGGGGDGLTNGEPVATKRSRTQS